MKKVILSGLVLVGLSSHVYAEDYSGVISAIGEAAAKTISAAQGKAPKTIKNISGVQVKNDVKVHNAAVLGSNLGVRFGSENSDTTVQNTTVDNRVKVEEAVLYNSNAGVEF